MHVLVTGADGFVGTTLCAHLLARGHAVRKIARTDGAGAIGIGDIAQFDGWATLLHDIDVVVHLAARAHVLRDTLHNPLARFREVNVIPTLRLATASMAAGVRRFVFLSSIGVNGSATTAAPFRETDSPSPREPYALSKWEAEQGLMRMAAGATMQVTRVRPPLVVGAGVKGNLLRLIRLADSAFPLPLGSILNLRNFIALPDLCELLGICVSHVSAGNELFLAADADPISTAELVAMMREGLSRPRRIVSVPLPLLWVALRAVGAHGELERMSWSLQVDSNRVRSLLGWHATTGLHRGVVEMAMAYRRSRK